jgi:ketosteroid isomerase-like protein
MRSIAAAAVTAMFMSMGCAASQRGAGRSADDGRELLALEQRVMDAIRTRDVAALEKLITDDFVLREPLKPDVDRRAFLEGIRAAPGTIEVVAGDGVQAKVERGGKVGIITGVQRVRVRLPDGKVVEDAGAFADLCVRRDGQWRMSVAFNVGLPPAPP